MHPFFDFLHRDDHAIGVGESLLLSSGYVTMGLAFGAWIPRSVTFSLLAGGVFYPLCRTRRDASSRQPDGHGVARVAGYAAGQ